MTEKIFRVLVCDECGERSPEGTKYAKSQYAWLTVRMWSGAPDFSIAMQDGPRGMRDELAGISEAMIHLCPKCVDVLRPMLVDRFVNAFGPVLAGTRSTKTEPYDADDIPF
jgi:hypothetical protein